MPLKRKIRIKKYANGIQSLSPFVDPNLGSPDYSKYAEFKDSLANKTFAAKQAASGIAGTVGKAAGIPFVGEALNGIDMLSTGITKDANGNYKNQFAKTIDNTLNPLNKVAAIASGNTSDIVDSFTFGLGSKAANSLGLNLGKSSQEIAEEKKRLAEEAAAYKAENAKYAGTDVTLNMPKYKHGVRRIYKKGVQKILAPVEEPTLTSRPIKIKRYSI